MSKWQSPTSAEFSVMVSVTVLLKKDILRLAILIKLVGSEGQENFLQVL